MLGLRSIAGRPPPPVATEHCIPDNADASMGYPRFGMLDLLKLLGGLLVGLFRSHAAREAETAFLRQQLVVLKLRLVQAGPRPRWRRAGKRAALLARYSSAPLIR